MADVEPPPGDALVRPAAADIKRAWSSLFSNPLLSTASLKRAALDGLPDADELSLTEIENWMPLRSLHWKLSLSILPSPAPQLFSTPLRTSRQAYDDLRFAYLRSPDGRYPADISVPPSRSGVGGHDRSSAQAAAPSDSTSNGVFDPLSLEDESPWKKYYKDLEVKKEIRKDVERTFPDVPYFKTDHARVMLTTILFLHCTLHPDVSYRQGMHELAAAMLLAVELDSLPSVADGSTVSAADAVLHETLSRAHVEHDAYALFSALMRNGAQAFYAHHPESDAPGVSRSPSAPEAKQPIIKVCDSMWELLGRIDPALKSKLDSEGIEPQLFGIRWVRLLFTREFPLPVAMSIWDALLALDPSLSLSTQLCITLLLRIRNLLLAGDYSDCLTSLLRYPGHSQEYPLDPLLLIQQALDIKEAPTPTTGVHLIIQNADLLGIPAQAPEVKQSAALDQRGTSRRGPPHPQQPPQHAQQRSLGLPASFNLNIGAAVAAAQSSGLGELAKGLAIKGREMGEKALREQVSQMRRNLPDFPTSPVSSSFLSPRPAGMVEFPSPVSPSATALEAEVASLKAKMWTLGAALDRCLTTLDTVQLALPQLPPTPSGEPGLDEKMARALVGVQIVRDALGDPERPFDQGLLREILASTAGGSMDDPFVEGETEPTSPVFTPIVSPSPVHQSPYIPPQPPSPSASPPPELPPPTTSTHVFGSLTGRTVPDSEGVALPNLAHSSDRLPAGPLPPPLPPPPPPPPPPSQGFPSYSPLATPILKVPAPPSRLPVGLAGSPPTAQPQSLAARLAQAAQKPATRPSSTTPIAAKPPPWARAGEDAARSSGSYPPAPPPLPPPPPWTNGDPLAGAPSMARSEHWRSVSSSKRPNGPAGPLNGGDPLGAL